MKDSEVKARLAQAEVHFSHYRWDDAIAMFEAVLAAHPDQPAATQGWANAVEQRSIDEELSLALAKARASLAVHRFDDALAVLNHAQTRGALSHILKYHSEIDGLRSEAQEGQEWQRRIDAARREVEGLAGRRRFDQALEVLDNTLRPLTGRGWEVLGAGLAQLRDRLWAERDVSERVQFAESAYERQDYRLATELAAALQEELPEREDVRRLHERARGAWGRVQDQLAAVNEALSSARPDDALALLSSLRSEHPLNPDWQAIALRVHMDQGRADVAAGRAAFVRHEFEDAAEAFERAQLGFATAVEIFPGHPTAAGEQAEAAALRDAALFAAQAVRDRAAFRWAASREGWQASRQQLGKGMDSRGRDFGEIVAVLDAMLGEAQAALTGLEQARLLLTEGRAALDAHDAGRARDAFRTALAQVQGSAWGDAADVGELQAQLEAGLRDAERIQRDVKKLLSQAEGNADTGERRKLLRRAYEQWETAPGLAARLADELLAAAAESAESGDDAAALALCEQARELSGIPAGALAAAREMAAGIQARRDGKAALAQAAAQIEAAGRTHPPSVEGFAEALAVLRSGEGAARELSAQFAALREQAQDSRDRAQAAKPLVEQSAALAAAGEWRSAADALDAALAALGPLASRELVARVAQLEAHADAVERALTPAIGALSRAEVQYALAGDGNLASVDWDALEQDLAAVRKALRAGPRLPAPLPAAWQETKTRAEALGRRSQVLADVHEKLAAGRGVEAVPILQADAAVTPDPVVLAVLGRLLHEVADDAPGVATGWLAQAAAALSRGELATAEAYLGLAESYIVAAPQVVPELRRAQRQAATLASIRAVTVEGRGCAARGDVDAALTCYRTALEMASDGEAGLASAVRRKLNRLLDLEDELGPNARDAGLVAARSLVESLLDGDASDPLLGEFVAPALARWWKLACRAARLAAVEAEVALGRGGVQAGAELVETYPRDKAAVELYRLATERTRAALLGRGQRRLARARRLATMGAYDEALVELSSAALALIADDAAVGAGWREELDALADEAADLRAELKALQALNSELTPLLDELRSQGLAGAPQKALDVAEQAELIDPRRAVAPFWAELDALAALLKERRDKPRTAEVSAPQPKPETPGVAGVEASAGLLRNQVFSRNLVSPLPRTRTDEAAMGPETAQPTVTPQPVEVESANRTPSISPAPDRSQERGPGGEVPPAPFDLDDWLSNVTELDPEDKAPGNER